MRAKIVLFLIIGILIAFNGVANTTLKLNSKASQMVKSDITYKTTPEGVLYLDIYYSDSVLSGKYK